MTTSASLSIEILSELSQTPPLEALRRALEFGLRLHRSEGREVSVLLCEDARMQELNRQWRGTDETTDVLSFPAGDYPGSPLGDIAISVPFAARQAASRGIHLELELAYLAAHGLLHLLAFEDATDDGRDQMIREMNRIAQAAGLPPDHSWASLHGESTP